MYYINQEVLADNLGGGRKGDMEERYASRLWMRSFDIDARVAIFLERWSLYLRV